MPNVLQERDDPQRNMYGVGQHAPARNFCSAQGVHGSKWDDKDNRHQALPLSILRSGLHLYFPTDGGESLVRSLVVDVCTLDYCRRYDTFCREVCAHHLCESHPTDVDPA